MLCVLLNRTVLRSSTPTSIIYLGRLRILCRYIFNLWHMRQGVDSLAQWLEHWFFIREDRVRFPRQAWNFSQLCFIPLLRLSCRKMGTKPGLDFTLPKMASRHHKRRRPWKGCVLRPSTPTSIICLCRLRILCRYIFNLWQMRQGVDSLAQWLEHWNFIREDRVRFPRQAWNFFSYASFLCCDFHVVRWGLSQDWTLLRRKWLHVIINYDFLEKGECYDLALLPRLSALADYA